MLRKMPGQKTVEGRTEEPSVLQHLNAVWWFKRKEKVLCEIQHSQPRHH